MTTMKLHTDPPNYSRSVLILAAAVVGLGLALLSLLAYLFARVQKTDTRAENQRRAICAILANIPGHVPSEIEHARQVFARHPSDCQPIVKATRTPAPSATPQRTPSSTRPTVVVIQPPSTAPHSTSPSPSHTASPRSSPTHSPTPRPSPTPSCQLIRHPLKCL